MQTGKQKAELATLLNRGFRYSLALTQNRSSAEDILQSAWLSVLKAKRDWTYPYLRAAIRSRFIDEKRRHQLIPIDSEPCSASEIDWDDNNRFAVNRISLEHALKEIRDEEREVLYLSIVEGFTAEEIGVIVEKPRGTVLSLAHRAREKMRNILNTKHARRQS